MKKFLEPIIDMEIMSVEDVITTSNTCPNNNETDTDWD